MFIYLFLSAQPRPPGWVNTYCPVCIAWYSEQKSALTASEIASHFNPAFSKYLRPLLADCHPPP
jgi:hypothetical protein